MRGTPLRRRAAARGIRWILVIALYGAGVAYAAGLHEPAAVHQSEPAASAPAEPAPESPMLTLSIAAGAIAGFGAYRLTATTARRRTRRVGRPSVATEPITVQR